MEFPTEPLLGDYKWLNHSSNCSSSRSKMSESEIASCEPKSVIIILNNNYIIIERDTFEQEHNTRKPSGHGNFQKREGPLRNNCLFFHE